MLTYTGKYNTAHVMIDEIEAELVQKIYKILNHPAFADAYIAIMPDCHEGAGACIGFTMTMNDYIVPNVVGVDIGCGVLACKLGEVAPDFEKLDAFIKQAIPSGFAHRDKIVYHDIDKWKQDDRWIQDFENDIYTACNNIVEDQQKVLHQLGTLGGGNHFIEVDLREETGEYWLAVHTGSRNFGLRVANFHQKKAKELMQETFVGAGAYTGLEYLLWEHGGRGYWEDMQTAQLFAAKNRYFIALQILQHLGLVYEDAEVIESVHNYISDKDSIIRKGAISVYSNERVIIPFNMRDGVAVGTGRSNKQWNYSAPHGAGRVMSRSQAKRELNLVDFEESMKGIYSSTVVQATLDEAPMVYKSKDTILETIKPTVDVEFLMKPVYNFKAAERQ